MLDITCSSIGLLSGVGVTGVGVISASFGASSVLFVTIGSEVAFLISSCGLTITSLVLFWICVWFSLLMIVGLVLLLKGISFVELSTWNSMLLLFEGMSFCIDAPMLTVSPNWFAWSWLISPEGNEFISTTSGSFCTEDERVSLLSLLKLSPRTFEHNKEMEYKATKMIVFNFIFLNY